MQTAIVTGAGSGIGQATAQRLATMGCRVVAVGRNADKLQSVRAAVGDVVVVRTLDVGDRDAVNALVAEIEAQFGPIAVLVNNAGVNAKRRSLAELTGDEWDRQLRINLTGAYNMIAAVLPGMRKTGGLIVNISSIAGPRPSKLSGAAYAASKAGLDALSSVVSQEEAKHGVRSSVIRPGEVDTPILEARPEPVTPERRAVILQPDDVAAAVAFLVSLPPRAHVPEMVVKPTAHLWQ
jgi:NADP-dependent 3-hydroxy acid dehydrogenase YdfG